MALPATDNFTASDGTALQTYSANWTIAGSGFEINTNSVRPTASADADAHWNADTFANDQYSQAVIVFVATNSWAGPSVRCSGAGNNCYRVYFDPDDFYVSEMVNGVYTQLANQAQAVVNGDLARMEVSGTSITIKLNGGIVYGPYTDTTLSSGYAGICGYNVNTRLDDWEGGNLAGAGVIGPLLDGHLVKHSILQGRLVT